MRSFSFRLAGGLAACAAFAWAPSAADAATCVFDPSSHTLTITTVPADIVTTVSVKADGSICGGGSVTNTDTIQLFQQGFEVDFQGIFEPGFTPEASGRSEIE